MMALVAVGTLNSSATYFRTAVNGASSGTETLGQRGVAKDKGGRLWGELAWRSRRKASEAGMGMERRRREEVHSGEGGVDAMTGNRVVWLRAPKLDSSTATACAQRGITVRVGG